MNWIELNYLRRTGFPVHQTSVPDSRVPFLIMTGSYSQCVGFLFSVWWVPVPSVSGSSCQYDGFLFPVCGVPFLSMTGSYSQCVRFLFPVCRVPLLSITGSCSRCVGFLFSKWQVANSGVTGKYIFRLYNLVIFLVYCVPILAVQGSYLYGRNINF